MIAITIITPSPIAIIGNKRGVISVTKSPVYCNIVSMLDVEKVKKVESMFFYFIF